jgi:hypothetical protein
MIDTVMTMYDKLANRTVQLTREINRRQQAEQAPRRRRSRCSAAAMPPRRRAWPSPTFWPA